MSGPLTHRRTVTSVLEVSQFAMQVPRCEMTARKVLRAPTPDCSWRMADNESEKERKNES